jgi:hypothetical protein
VCLLFYLLLTARAIFQDAYTGLHTLRLLRRKTSEETIVETSIGAKKKSPE